MLGAAVELCRGQRMQHRDQAMRGVVGKMRVGGMTLDAMDREPASHAAAPADLDHVAQRLRAGRLADEASINGLVAALEPIEHLAGAVDRRSFLVSGDQQADRAGEVPPALQKGLHRRDEGGDRSLHVYGTAAAQ